MPTPSDFDGIFYSPDTGSDYIFDQGADFIGMIEGQSDGLFLSLGAYVDLLVNGQNELAEAVLNRTRTTWPAIRWDRIDQILATVKQLAFESKPEGWRHTVYEMISQAALPSSHITPADYQSRFFTDELISAVFSFRGGVVQHIQNGYGDDYRLLVFILVDLDLNHQDELATEIEERMRAVCTNLNWDRVKRLRELAKGLEAQGKFNLQSLSYVINEN